MAATLVTVAVAAPVERINLALGEPLPMAATPEIAEDVYGALPAPTAPVPAGIPPDGATPATPAGRVDERAAAPETIGRAPVLAATPEAGETPALLEAKAPTAETVVPGREPLPAATPED